MSSTAATRGPTAITSSPLEVFVLRLRLGTGILRPMAEGFSYFKFGVSSYVSICRLLLLFHDTEKGKR